MTRVLQCLVWITVMTVSGRAQRDYPNKYLNNPHSIIFPEATHEKLNHRQTEQQPELNGRQRMQNKISELRRTDQQIHLNKRDAIESELSSQMVFPGLSSRTKLEPEVSEHCRKLGYCESIPPSYPKDTVKKIISKLGDAVDDTFQMDMLDTNSSGQIEQRYGSEGMLIKLCESVMQVTIPYLLPDKDDVWWEVLQYPELNMTQGFRTETCLVNNCSGLAYFKPEFKCKCEQLYAFREVYTVEKNNSKRIKRFLKVPSCCSSALISRI